jgi:hypothetical protein
MIQDEMRVGVLGRRLELHDPLFASFGVQVVFSHAESGVGLKKGVRRSVKGSRPPKASSRGVGGGAKRTENSRRHPEKNERRDDDSRPSVSPKTMSAHRDA